VTVLRYTNLPFMETHFREKIVSINDYGFSFNGYGFPSQSCGFPLNGYGFLSPGYGFPLHGNFLQNLKSCFQPKN
jgi:hypothetical protein